MNTFILWIAQGFGVGRIPIAPGTFGSIVGIAWFALLLLTGSFWLFIGGTIFGVALSVWACGAGETILQQKDPGSIVMDEIAAIPLCFSSWIGMLILKNGMLPTPSYFFSKENWWLTFGIFALFRIFDVLKPWPVKQSQSLPGGWGVTVDDVLAAIYVSVLTLVVGVLHQR